MIDVKHVNLIINKREILKDISLTFENGKIYCLVGRNGSGKTMLMKCICGFVKPTSGEVICDGKVVGRDLDYLHGAGVIIENPVFIPYYSGFRNLKLLSSIRRRIKDEEIYNTMVSCGLDPKLKLSVKKYSLGMRQRLAIAQAIMEKPSILILDEPMNGLDVNGVYEIRRLLLRIKEEGCLIIIASHNKEDVKTLCDVVIKIEKGEIVLNKYRGDDI